MEKSKIKIMLSIVLLTSLLGCATTHTYVAPEPTNVTFTVTNEDLKGENYVDLDAGPQEMVRDSMKAWKIHDYQRAGDLLMNTYRKVKNNGGVWSTDSKIRVLSHSLFAYYRASSIEKEREVARYMLSELSEIEKSYLTQEVKILIYFNSLDQDSPAFEAEIPRSLKIKHTFDKEAFR